MSRNKRTRNLPEDLSDWTMQQLQAELVYCRKRIEFFEYAGHRRNYIETLKHLKQVLKAMEEKLKDDDDEEAASRPSRTTTGLRDRRSGQSR